MKKLIILLLLLFTGLLSAQTTLRLGQIDTIWGTGQVPRGANNTNTWYTLFNRADSIVDGKYVPYKNGTQNVNLSHTITANNFSGTNGISSFTNINLLANGSLNEVMENESLTSTVSTANTFSVTGASSTTITSFGYSGTGTAGAKRKFIFGVSLILKDTATLNLPSTYTTAIGDIMDFIQTSSTPSSWLYTGGIHADGTPIFSALSPITLLGDVTGTGTGTVTTTFKASPTFTGTLTAPTVTTTTLTLGSTNITTIGSGLSVTSGTLTASGGGSGVYGIPNSSGVYTYYSTLRLAIAAASAGQTIQMFTNVTEASAIVKLKNGVNINLNGYTYTYSGTAGTPFTDSSGAPTCSIIDGTIMVTNYTGYAMQSSGITYGTGLQIISTNGLGYNCGNGGKVYGVNSVTKNYAFVFGNSSSEGFNLYGEVNGVLGSSYTTLSNNGSVYNSTFKNTGGTGTNYIVSSSGNHYNCFFYSTGYSALSGGNYYNCEARAQRTVFYNCTDVINCYANAYLDYYCYQGCTNVKNCDGYANAGDTYISCTNVKKCTGSCGSYGTVYFGCTLMEDCEGISVSPVMYNCTKVVGGKFICTGGGDAAELCYDITGAYVENQYNNASGHGISVGTTTAKIIDCTIKVANASANCLNATGAANINYTQCRFTGATTPVNANITQSNANLTDSQGNTKY